jgi:uracil-DNA glycosylase family 4
MKDLIHQITNCSICAQDLVLGPRPIFKVSQNSRIVIIGQAPGRIVHETGIPWNDKSGENLMNWMGISSDVFYDSEKVAIIPMGFCYPGKGKTGDLPPRKECAPLWHNSLLENISNPALVILIGKYAQDYYLNTSTKRNLTETVKNFSEYLPQYFVLPHPSPRNNIWMKKNPWFKEDVLPEFQTQIQKALLTP